MGTATHVPLELYLCSSYEPDAEYVDGEIEERTMGENDHSAWQGAIFALFYENRVAWGVRIRPELRVQVGPMRFRVPDVTVLDRDRPAEPIVTLPPIAVFEVLSPEDTVRRLMRKLNDYATMGIPEIWVVDPETKIFSRFEDGQLIRRDKFSYAPKGILFATSRIGEFLD